MKQCLEWLYRRLFRPLLPKFVLEMQDRASAWRRIRAEHLKKEPVCQACGRSRELEVHHVIPVSFAPEKELDPNNLITLCGSPCHIVFGHLMNYHCYNKDVRKMAADYRRALNKRKCLR